MDRSRRNFLQSSVVLGAGVVATRAAASTPLEHGQENMQMPPGDKMHAHSKSTHHTALSGAGLLPVVTTDVPDLPFEMDNGVKVFHLVT